MKSPTEPTGADSASPVLVVWSLRDDLEQSVGYIGRTGQNRPTGHGIDSGHHIAKEAPEALVSTLLPFLRDPHNDARPTRV